jgi:pimeloyl-ACP methyl ester carboxylesterase
MAGSPEVNGTVAPARAMSDPDTVRGPRRRSLLAAAALAGAGGLLGTGGCAYLPRPATVPMKTLEFPAACAGPAPVLLVFLPGAYSRPQDFVDEGFVAALADAGVTADVVVPDAHLAYFDDRSVLRRLHADVLGPARAAAPQRQVWLVGISLGAFAALGVLARATDPVDGMLLIAPYPGRRPLLQAIEAAGGPPAWVRDARPEGDDDLEFEIWSTLARRPSDATPPVYAAYGRDDRFAEGQAMLASTLPPSRVATRPGGHDWPVWRALWRDWLARGLLPRGCGT